MFLHKCENLYLNFKNRHRDTRVIKGIFDSLQQQNLNHCREETVLKTLALYQHKTQKELLNPENGAGERFFEDAEQIFSLLFENPWIFERHQEKFDNFFFKFVQSMMPAITNILNEEAHKKEKPERMSILSLPWDPENFGHLRFLYQFMGFVLGLSELTNPGEKRPIKYLNERFSDGIFVQHLSMKEMLLSSLEYLNKLGENYQAVQYYQYPYQSLHEFFASFNGSIFREFFGIIGLFSFFKEVNIFFGILNLKI